MVESEISQIFGISKETLKCVVSNKHRNDIASRTGDAWESLATFIGVSPEDVHDIKEEYRKPLDRRLAMMRRWHELWGSEASYRRLVEGLRQIGRRDLIELFKQDTQLRPSESHLIQDKESVGPSDTCAVVYSVIILMLFLAL